MPGWSSSSSTQSPYDEILWSPDVTTKPSEKCYDDKYNLECEDVAKEEEGTVSSQKDTTNRGMSGTMSLVIGIILASFISMVLIVIIVLKVRTGVDINEYKQVFYYRVLLNHCLISCYILLLK